MRFTTDENEDCRDIAVRVRELGTAVPIYEDDTDDEFLEALRAINAAQRETPREVKNAYRRDYCKKHREQIREYDRKYRMKKKGEI